MKEFDFIREYLFARQKNPVDLLLGIGDDAAVFRPDGLHDWHISSDMMVVDRHFFANDAAGDIAWKLLAVNLSDMAAMGAKPRFVLLSVALPILDQGWLRAFCDVFFATAEKFGVTLIGGDTTCGPLALNVTILGQTPKGEALRRGAAKVDDDIWVSGELGLAAAALAAHLGAVELPDDLWRLCEQRRLRPYPRLALGQALLPLAHAAQDISDGLWQDLGHIATASGLGACVEYDAINTQQGLKSYPQSQRWLLAGGDDYELVFTAPKQHRVAIADLSQTLGVTLTRIGRIVNDIGVRVYDQSGRLIPLREKGFDHFEA